MLEIFEDALSCSGKTATHKTDKLPHWTSIEESAPVNA